MIRPAVTASLTALGISAVSNIVVVTFYDLAFIGFWDRLFFVIGMSSLAALLAGTAIALAQYVCERLLNLQARCRSTVQLIAVLVIISVGVGIWADAFLTGAARTVALGGILSLSMLTLVTRRSGRDQGQVRSRAGGVFWWVSLSMVCVVSWLLAGSIEQVRRPPVAEQTPPRSSSGQTLPSQTNLLLLVIDTLRGDHLGFEGYARNTSPNIDRLAKEGVAFRSTTAQATRTSPSMASLMTATTPLTHGVIESRSVLPAEIPTLGKMLQAAGYETAAIVANPMVGQDFGYGQGYSLFDEIFRESSDSIDAATIVDRAIDLLEEPLPEPFALWLHFVDPHTPYDAPDPWASKFLGDPLYETQASEDLPVGGRIGAMRSSARVEGYASLRDYIALYDAEIRYTDAEIGRLLEFLEKSGLLQDTLIVLTSDHGESLGEHDYFFSHGAYSYESTSRVPLVFHHPLLEASRPYSGVPRLMDMVPSIVDLMGLTRSRHLEGVSLFSEAAGKGSDAVAPILSGSADYINLAVRTERAKLVLVPRHWRAFDKISRQKLAFWPSRARTFPTLARAFRRELYDLSTDPGEVTNLAGRTPEMEEPLLLALLDWVERVPALVAAAKQKSRNDLDPEVERQLEALGYLE